MPEYTYHCEKCQAKFSVACSIREYVEVVGCVSCKNRKCHRLYREDLLSLNTSVKKSDSELKTIGDIANRNRDKLSVDQKDDLRHKHNAYKETESEKILPKGMSRIKKPPKPKWIT